ncbi:tubulin-specific chaperone E [Thalassophryne amazonica]|uniref:tubulin-specific chaperone E n=1 Tax=Thalassophryne amazonica TaxID=390379 RepID=UPI0014711EBD|nr:tubulin-specific chaperone E [Thalassophryne amazonica]
MGVDQVELEVPVDAVGRRVSCDGERATVRYVGQVPPTTGLWLGLEWDNPDRGKHAGSHNGVQYFTCRCPTGGSFVRPAKVNFGVDYATALRRAYLGDEEVDPSIKFIHSGVVFKERSLEKLSSVLLNRSDVNGPGADRRSSKITPNVQWLDMCETLLASWEDVAAITQQMDKLKELLLSYNSLRLPSDPLALSAAFSNLKVLSLIGTHLTWPQILECAPMWPQLEELCVENNNITELSRPMDVLQSLRSLNVSHNLLVQDTVLSLAALPSLETLNLSTSGLSSIRFDDTPPGSKTSMFPQLKRLYLDDNHISEWTVVDELAKLPRLSELSCLRNRLVSRDGNSATAAQMFIAKLGQLVSLNRVKICPEARRGAELDYMKLFGEEWLKAGGRSQLSSGFIRQHPRYLNLIQKYAPEEGELKKQDTSSLKNELLKVTFTFPDDPDQKPMEKKLPASMTVQKVKGFLQRKLKVPVSDLQLTYVSPSMGDKEIEFNGDLKTLHLHSIEDGDNIVVRWSGPAP